MNKIIEVVDTKITDKWGVQWDEMETSRDFLQNFYDANSITDITIKNEGKTVTVSAPAVFDYNELIYLGSDKGLDSSTIGQYGEGFKASVVNALRNWNCEVEMIIQNRHLKFFFENKKIGANDKKVVFCEVSECEPYLGSQLIVKNCSNRLIEEFKFGLNYFYSESNPLFGEVLVNQGDLVVYKSVDKNNGYVFYKKLLRCKIDLPIIIVCNRDYKNVDAKIKHDRDRKAFNEEVLESLLKLFFRGIGNWAITGIVLNLDKWWANGHKILSTMADSMKYGYQVSNKFPENYYAKEHTVSSDNFELKVEINKVIDEYKAKEFICCPSYMGRFGMKRPNAIAEQQIKERKDRLNKSYTREITLLEKQGINILSYFIKDLSENLYLKFENAKYTVGDSEEVIGELKTKRSYNQQHIFLNKIFFTFSFNEALAVLLHEWAHIYGGDGSRTFSDALTYFISLILKNENVVSRIKDYEKKWENTVIQINKERNEISQKNFYDVVDTLSQMQMNNILKKIPEDELFKLLSENKLI